MVDHMLVQIAHLDPALLAPVLFGILTIFGKKKKKDEKGEEGKTGDSAVGAPNPSVGPNASAQAPKNSELGNLDFPNTASLSEETSSLTKLLQSLMQELPANPSHEADPALNMPRSTPEYVPPRNDPPSRPMVILPEDKGKKPEPIGPVEPVEPAKLAPKKEAMLPAPLETPPRGPIGPAPAVARPERIEEETKNLARPERFEREKEKPQKSPTSKPPQGFEHVFDITQGSLKAPGLVVITGPPASGKTTLCQSLAGAFLRQGSPCLFVAYDKPTSAVRDGMKKLGCDPASYESQFRFLVVDGYSAQSEGFSLEPYNFEKPFDLDNVEDTLVRDAQIFLGERTVVIFDSANALVSRVPAKEFVTKFREIVGKLKETGATFVLAVDSGKLSKDILGPLQDNADCIIALEKEGAGDARLRVLKVNGSETKSEPEPFEIDTNKGLVFV